MCQSAKAAFMRLLSFKRINTCMRILEITTNIKPLTTQQARVSALKQQKERASDMLKAEREQQRRQKATQAIQKNNAVLTKLNNN